MKQVQKINYTSLPLLLALLVLPFVHFNSLLDIALVSKFLCLSFLLLPFPIFLWVNKDQSKTTSLPFFHLLAFAYYIWQILSISWAFNPVEAIFGVQKTGLWLITFWYAWWLLDQKKLQAKHLFLVVSIGALLYSLVGWYQVTQVENMSFMSDVNKIVGFSGNKNLFAILLFLQLPFILLAIKEHAGKWRWLSLISLASSLILMLTLLGRATLLGLFTSALCSLLLYFIFAQQRQLPWKKIAIGSLILIGGLFSVFAIKGDVNILKRYNIANFKGSQSAQERLVMWENTLEMIGEQPVLGYGVGNWALFFPSKGIDRIPRMAEYRKPAARPHNDFLWIAAELGLIGLLIHLSLFLSLFVLTWIAIKHWQKQKEVSSSDFYGLLICSSILLGYLVISFFDFPRERVELQAYLAVIMAYLLVLCSRYKSIPKVVLPNIANKLIALIFFISLVSNLVMGYYRWDGEHKSIAIQKAMSQQDPKALEKASKQVKNPFYQIDPLLNPVDYYHGFALLVQDKPRKAIPYFQKSLDIFPYHFNSLYYAGRANQQLNLPEVTTKYYERLLEINPKFIEAREIVGVHYFNQGDHAKAQELLEGLDSNKAAVQSVQRHLKGL